MFHKRNVSLSDEEPQLKTLEYTCSIYMTSTLYILIIIHLNPADYVEHTTFITILYIFTEKKHTQIDLVYRSNKKKRLIRKKRSKIFLCCLIFVMSRHFVIRFMFVMNWKHYAIFVGYVCDELETLCHLRWVAAAAGPWPP